MLSNTSEIYPVRWQEDRVVLIDQTRLPNECTLVEISRCHDLAEAIKSMIVRGAPAIGVAAAYGMYLGAKEIKTDNTQEFHQELAKIAQLLRDTRPTAVNLFWAITRMLKTANETPGTVEEITAALLKTAQSIQTEDVQTCKTIGQNGLLALPQQPAKLRILTHCNTGSLATAGYGTALGVIRAVKSAGRL